MKKAFKFRIETSRAVEQKLEATLDICRELYNGGLQERRDAYKLAGKSINYHAQAIELPEIKEIRPDVGAIHSQVLQETLKRLQRAFDGFFRRIKEGSTPGYPRFKGKARYDSFTYPQGGWKLAGDKLTLSKIGSMRVRLSRSIVGKIKTVTIKRETDKWYVVFSCEVESQAIASTGKAIAIDVNLENFYTDHTGKKVDNPKHLRKSEHKLKKAQKKLSRKKKGSSHWQRARQKVARIHTKIKNQRKDFAHKQSRKIVNNNDLIFYENLNIAGMVHNHQLAKSISDVGWGMFFDMLDYKAADANKLAVNVTPNSTSQSCSGCGKKVPKGLGMRWHRCPYCRLVLHRDKNAAINILARGISTLLQTGGLPVSAPGGLALARLLKGEPVESSAKRLPHSFVSATA
ncbi:MAG: transposase [Acidobacteriota bacterium]